MTLRIDQSLSLPATPRVVSGFCAAPVGLGMLGLLFDVFNHVLDLVFAQTGCQRRVVICGRWGGFF